MPAPSDLVHQQTISTGTGALTLTAVNGKRTFLTAFGTGGTDTFDYYVSNRNAAEWERGTGHESAGTLVRDTVLASSNAGALVAFSAGLKDVTNDVPAANQALRDTNNQFSESQTVTGDLTVTRTDDSVNINPLLILDRNSAAPVSGGGLGAIVFFGDDAVGTQFTYAGIIGVSSSTTAGTPDGRIHFNVLLNGAAVTPFMVLESGARVIGHLQFPGSTSGTVIMQPQAVAGSPTLTLPNTTGTFAVGASAPLSLSTTTGNMSWTGAAFTKTDDTNVTATLGGAPTTAVGTAMSLTLGWTGTLSVARGGTAAATAQEAAKSLGIPWVLAQSWVAVAHTGTTAPTTLATITVPGNSMGANGCLRIRVLWTANNDASLKTVRVRFNGTAFSANGMANCASQQVDITIGNRNSASSQIGGLGVQTTWGNSSSNVTSAHDTTTSKDIILTAELADSADTLTLEGYIVEVLYKA